jgi:hypothetical protein
VLFTKLEDGKPIITLAELRLEKQEIYDWDSMQMDQRINWPVTCAIVVRRENSLENIFIMEDEYQEIVFDLKVNRIMISKIYN